MVLAALAAPSFFHGEVELQECLARLSALEDPECAREGDWETEHRALQIIVAHGIQNRVKLASRWTKQEDPAEVNEVMVRQMAASQREPARRALKAYPAPADEEVRWARERLEPLLRDVGPGAAKESDDSLLALIWLGSVIAWAPLVPIGIAALFTAPIFAGGLIFRLFGLAVVRHDGSRASRTRCLLRALIVWGPPVLATLLIFDVAGWDLLPRRVERLVPVVVVLIMLAGAIWTILRPSRGPHDRLAGTTVVPR